MSACTAAVAVAVTAVMGVRLNSDCKEVAPIKAREGGGGWNSVHEAHKHSVVPTPLRMQYCPYTPKFVASNVAHSHK